MHQIEQIEKYLGKSLESDQVQNMEERLAGDKDFAGQYEVFKTLMDGIKYAGRKELLEEIKEWDAEMGLAIPEEKPMLTIKPRKWYYIAAVIVFFMVAGIVLNNISQPSYDSLVASYYQPYHQLNNAVRGDNDHTASPIDDAFDFYDRGDYEQAILILQKLPSEEVTESSDFIYANALQAEKKYEEAEEIYARIIENNSIYKVGSQWYLALCKLALHKVKDAKVILEDVKHTNSSYASNAKSLLQELN